MGKRILCMAVTIVFLIAQSATISLADTGNSKGSTTGATITTPIKASDELLSREEYAEQVAQLKIDQAQLKKDQEQLKKDQEELKKQQAQLKIDQDKLKVEQEKLKKEQDKKAIEENRKKLGGQLTSSTYLKYIKELGYYRSTSKNDQNLNIRNAVLLFQSDHNMSVTGKWDTATKNMLIERLLSKEIHYADKVTQAPSDGKWVVVNKTKRILTLYDNTKVVKKYAVAVGNPASLTKSGKFVVVNKAINPDWGGGGFAAPVKGGIPQNPLGSRWIGINRTDGSYGIHGTNSFYSIGTYASHGCIRMQNYCVEELYPYVPVKANIWVGTDAELKKWGITQDEFKYTVD